MGDVLRLVPPHRKKHGSGNGNDGGEQCWLKRLAVQIAGQLPEDTADALTVLVLAERIVREFMSGS
jgi:hypothetical protein